MTNEFELPPLPLTDGEVKTAFGRRNVYYRNTVESYATAARAPLLAEIDRLRAELADFRHAAGVSATTMQALSAERDALLVRIAELEGERARIARLCDDRAGVIDGLREYLRDFEGDRERLRAELDTLKLAVDSARLIISQRDSELAEKSAALEAVRADAERWRQHKKDRPVLLVTGYFGNGTNRRVEDVEALLDADRAAQATEQQAQGGEG